MGTDLIEKMPVMGNDDDSVVETGKNPDDMLPFKVAAGQSQHCYKLASRRTGADGNGQIWLGADRKNA